MHSCPHHEGARNAGRTMRPQPRVQKWKAHECSHHESTGHIRRSARSGFFGLLRALPGNALGLTPSSPRYVTCARSGAGRDGPDSVRDHTTWADAQRRCKWGESPPRSAPRSVVRQPMVRASRFAGVRTHPLYKECASPQTCALDTRRRPDAGAITASPPRD